MERRGELRAELKRWEAAFALERGRRPGQWRRPPRRSDVSAGTAPGSPLPQYSQYSRYSQCPKRVSRSAGLYREYGRLKRSGKQADAPDREPSEQDSGSWGSHLNRRPQDPALSTRDPDALPALAQYFGMKLKSNLGAALKERPPVPRRTLAPRPPAVPKAGDKEPSPAEAPRDPELRLPPSVAALAPVVLSAKPASQGNKFQRLRRTLVRRLGSLDPEWLRSSPALAAALAGRAPSADSADFDVVALSDSMGWEAPLVKRALRQLQWDPRLRPGGLRVEFSGLSFHVRAYGDLAPRELDAACAFVHGRAAARERAALAQLRACFRAFRSVATETCAPEPPAARDKRSARLKALLRDYFEEDPDGAAPERDGDGDSDTEERAREDAKLREWESQIRADIRHFLSVRHDERFTGRAVARVFHGIGSPCFPAQVYGRDRRFWRRHLAVDFHALACLATDEILSSR